MGLTTLKDLLLNGCGREDTCLQILFDATLSGSPQVSLPAYLISSITCNEYTICVFLQYCSVVLMLLLLPRSFMVVAVYPRGLR